MAQAQQRKNSSAPIDFSDPDWKFKFQRDFEERFNIPHLTDIFPDAEAFRSTFCLKMRYRLSLSLSYSIFVIVAV